MPTSEQEMRRDGGGREVVLLPLVLARAGLGRLKFASMGVQEGVSERCQQLSTVSLMWSCPWGGLWGYLLPNMSLLLFSWRSGLGTLVQAVLRGTGHQGGLCTKLSS